MIVLMRRLWTEENVTFTGKHFAVESVSIMLRLAEKGAANLDRRAQRSGAQANWPIGRRLAGFFGLGQRSETGDRVDTPPRNRGRQASSRRSFRRAPFLSISPAAPTKRSRSPAAPSVHAQICHSANYRVRHARSDVRDRVQAYIAAGATKVHHAPLRAVRRLARTGGNLGARSDSADANIELRQGLSAWAERSSARAAPERLPMPG